MDPVEPDHRRLRPKVYDGIIDLVISGDLLLEQKTSEPALAEALGVSRTPVREAIAILASEGVVEQRSQVGVWVKRVTSNEMAELVQVSRVVERVALENLDQQTIEQHMQHLASSLGQVAVMSGLYRAEPSRLQDQFLKTEAHFHELLTEVGMTGAAGPKLVALWGLKRRLFHLEHPIDASFAKFASETDTKILIAMLENNFEGAGEALEHYYSTHPVLAGDTSL